jgi:hypothetical protein
MDPNCPWSDLAPSTLQWCEAQLCAWIREPANTYSNLAYIALGIYMLYDSRCSKLAYLKLLGYFNILLGFMSGFYHASGSLIGEMFDFSAMFLFSAYFIVAALARLYSWHNTKVILTALLLAVITIGALFSYPPLGPYMFAAQIVTAAFLEHQIWMKPGVKHASFRNFVIAFSVLLIAFFIWNLDRSRIVCFADVHWINGHAVWHLLTATSTFFVYKFYTQFKDIAAYDFSKRRKPETV